MEERRTHEERRTTKEELILTELRQQSSRLSNIETAVRAIATQQIEIAHLQRDISKLWEKYDTIIADGGIINRISRWQASCPRDEVKALNKKFWALLTVIALIVVGAAAKTILA